MKKSLIIAAALPLASLGAGFGAGQFLSNQVEAAAALDAPAPDPRDAAERHLEAAAEAAATGAPSGHAATTADAGHGAAETAAPGAHDPLLQTASAEPAPALPGGHAGQAAAQPHETAPQAAAGGHGAAPAEPDAPQVVSLGQMTVPVYKPSSVTYVVADFGVSVPDKSRAEHYRVPENAARLRDAILFSMTRAAGKPVMNGAAIDTEALSSAIQSEIAPSFGDDIDQVLFLSLYKMDVPRI